MFNTTLRYLNLIILPHPSFDVPPSEADPDFQMHGRKGDNDTSYISQNQISQFGPIEFSTPRKPVLKANSSHERRRNTICCYSCHLADSSPANEDGPTWPVNMSFNSFLSSDTSRYYFYENVPVPSTSTGVKIAAPHGSLSPSSSWVRQPRITSFVDFSDSKKIKNKSENASKGREKRNSAPAAVSLGKERFSEVIDITSTKDTTQSHPTIFHKDQRPKPHATSISPKHFEIGLSPIIEDTHTFPNTLRGPKSVEKKPATTDTVDSSESSYGELIQKKTINYLSTSEYEYEAFGGLEWENQERNKQPLSFARFNTQDYADRQGDRYWSDEFWETFEDSSLIPEVTLTAPTPEMATSAKFRSETWPCESSLDYQLPEADAYRPSRLGYTTALASISKALGTGADMLLGVGGGVFDDMLDAGADSCGTSQLPASASAHDHLGDDCLGSLAAQPLGKSQVETGFLGRLLRRKGTGSQISERRDRVWQRVSRLLHSSRRSSRSAHDQAKNTASASLATNGPRNATRGWKRFSRILGSVTVSSRRRSAGDQVQFTESIDPARSGLSGFGSTRRHGLDIPSESADQVGERWYGSSPPGAARPERNFSGVKILDHESRRHSFGLHFGMKIPKLRWRSSAEGPGSLWSTEDERIRNRFERHSVVY